MRLCLLFMILVVAACTRSQDATLVYRDADDPALAAAKAKAHARWNEFAAATDARFVKIPLEVQRGVGREHVWLKVASIEGDTITGVLDNTPVEDVGHKAGDPITAKRSDVEDWMIMKNGEMIGGFTVEVLKQRQR